MRVAFGLLIFGLFAIFIVGEASSLEDVLRKNNLTGVASLWKGNALERVATGVNGYADAYESRPIRIDSRYPVASNTKLYVAVSLYQLQEAGQVNLSDSIADYLTSEDFANFGLPNISTYCPRLSSSSRAKLLHSCSC